MPIWRLKQNHFNSGLAGDFGFLGPRRRDTGPTACLLRTWLDSAAGVAAPEPTTPAIGLPLLDRLASRLEVMIG